MPKKTVSKKRTTPTKNVADAPVEAVVVVGPIPNVVQLFRSSAGIIKRNLGLFARIGGIYGLFSLIFQGQGLFSVNNLSGVTSGTNDGSVVNTLGSAVTALGGGSGDQSNATSGTLQFMLMLIVSLVLIWTLRQIHARHHVKAKEAYYRSTTPLVPFLIVLLVIALQLLPLLFGASLYQILIGGGIMTSGLEQVITTVICLLLVWPTLYWTTASVFAAYIVTLPEMTPRTALRSARELVFKRRLKVFGRLIALPLVLLTLTAVVLVPVITVASRLTQVVFFITTTVTFVIMHTYMYELYRGLLDE